MTPPKGVAGELGTWRLCVKITSGAIESETEIIVTPQQKTNKIWPPSQNQDPWALNYTKVETDAAAEVELLPPSAGILRGAQKYSIRARVVSGGIGPGQSITFVFGDTSAGSPGMRMLSTNCQFRMAVAFIRSGEDTAAALCEGPLFKLEAAAPARVKAVVPSTVLPGEDVPLRTHLLDEFGNPCGGSDHIEIVPVPGVELAVRKEEGIRHFRVSDRVDPNGFRFHLRHHGLEGWSNPVRIQSDETALKIFWGDLHAHSNLAQGAEPPEFVYRWAKEIEGLDFLAHVEHEAAGDIDLWVGDEFKQYRPGMKDIREYIAECWNIRRQLVKEHNSPGEFVPLLGFEWASNRYGHMNVLYPGEDGPLHVLEGFWQEDFDQDELWKRLAGQSAITIPHHCSTVRYWGYASGTNWGYYSREFLRVAEIYSKWGSSEHFGCPRATAHQMPGGTLMNGLMKGHRFGFVGGSDSHASRPGSDFVECGWDGIYSQSGLTAVYAPQLTREAIYAAIYRRHCYATTGVRMLINFGVMDQPMGSEVTLDSPERSKEIHYDVTGTAPLDRIEIVKNGSVMYRHSLAGRETMQAKYTIPDHEATSAGGDFYYLRVLQEDGSLGWASPVWVSCPE